MRKLNWKPVVCVAMAAALGALLESSPAIAGDYLPDAQFAARRVRAAFFAEEPAELGYAMRSVVIACVSEAVTSPGLDVAAAPCNVLARQQREGCGTSGASEVDRLRCAGSLVDDEVSREKGWEPDVSKVLREVRARLARAVAQERAISAQR